jgi:hypothetical protein
MRLALIFLALLPFEANASLFGEENVPLYKLVLGQVMELQRLAESVGIEREQMKLLIQINEGIERTTSQINSMEAIVQRAQGLDPKSIRRISDLTGQINELKALKTDVEDLVAVKLLLSEQAVAQSAIQSDTAYKMGQEMIGTGTVLAADARRASPGRAAQISASAQSAGMLSQGVMLQTMAQMTQIQAMSLELQKTEMEKNLNAERGRRRFLGKALLAKRSQK